MVKYTGKTHKHERENDQIHRKNTQTRARKWSNTLVKHTNGNAKMIKYTGKTYKRENDQVHC